MGALCRQLFEDTAAVGVLVEGLLVRDGEGGVSLVKEGNAYITTQFLGMGFVPSRGDWCEMERNGPSVMESRVIP